MPPPPNGSGSNGARSSWPAAAVTLKLGVQATPQEPGLAEAYDQLSQTSRYRRFFTGKPHLSEQSLGYFTDVDHRDHEALVAVVPGSGQLVGVARYIRIPGQPDQAEVAITVLDSWQRRGLGTVLLRELAQGRRRRASGTSSRRSWPRTGPW